ncbi:MAG: DUF721 domain-containing protein [Coriobacteriia bacterium]|nr:DUF721 domain-containing protein [Coriobacteriia bacterium]
MGSEGQKAHPQRLADLIERLLARADRGDGLLKARVCSAWEEVAGPAACKHSRAVRLSEGELVVAVDSAAWANEMSLMAGRYLAALQKRFGNEAVRGIRFTVSRLPKAVAGESRAASLHVSTDTPLTPEQMRAIETRVGRAVADDALRTTIVKAVAAVVKSTEEGVQHGREERG